jgi:hypothetical protein
MDIKVNGPMERQCVLSHNTLHYQTSKWSVGNTVLGETEWYISVEYNAIGVDLLSFIPDRECLILP